MTIPLDPSYNWILFVLPDKLCVLVMAGILQGYSGGLLSDGQYIANYSNIILVSINYRLGALGFLVYGSNLEIGGNYGLKVCII